MRILADVPRYPPGCNAGAEWSVHVILRELGRHGHEPTVHVAEASGSSSVDGVAVFGALPRDALDHLYAEAEVVVTHLDRTRPAVGLALAHDRPLVHLVHNHWHLRRHRVVPAESSLVVFCATWLERVVRWPGPAIVVRPPVFAGDYRTVPGDCVTLLNLSEVKGGPLLFELARRQPHRRFLAVMGGYDVQLVPDVVPPNVEVLPNTADVVADVYRRTRVLLVPSRYEPWGRVAVEAACSGIPVIAHPASGLQEALGDAGLYCDRDDVAGWTATLDLLDDPAEWERWSARVRARADALDPTADLDLLERELTRLVAAPAHV